MPAHGYEHWIEADVPCGQAYQAELRCLQGELLLARDGLAPAEEVMACFKQATQIAVKQDARGCELRAAMSLVRLWQAQGRRDEARELLAPIYDWFTEGFYTRDLIEAKALLDELQ